MMLCGITLTLFLLAVMVAFTADDDGETVTATVSETTASEAAVGRASELQQGARYK